MTEFLNTSFTIFSGLEISILQIIAVAFLILISLFTIRVLFRRWIPSLQTKYDISVKDKRALKRILIYLITLLWILLLLLIIRWDYTILEREPIDITIKLALQALIIIQLARLLDWGIAHIFFKKYYESRDHILNASDHDSGYANRKERGNSLFQYIVYTIAAILIISSFDLDFQIYDIEYKTGDHKGEVISFQLTNIIKAILIILIARLLVWITTQFFLYNIYKRNRVDIGAQFAINQLINYVIYVIAVIIAIESLGFQMTLIWGGAAALLVGVGLGLQQTFNDFASGIVLLFERTVKIGDVLDVNGVVGSVKKIGLRASLIESRDNVTIVVPNSKLVNENVINWTHYDDKVRFQMNVGVAYGSDTALVKKLLLEAVKGNPYIVKYPAPFIRFNDFGGSSLDFTLYFFSRNYIVIEDIKSDIRFEVDRLFREHDISIPFPQRDVWIRKE